MNYSSELYGDIDAPETLGELLQVANTGGWAPGYETKRLWRGHADIRWRLDSGAVRRKIATRRNANLITKSPESFPTEREIARYELELIRRAEAQGYRQYQGRRLSDLELLTLLQHYGAATRLIDFSRSLLIALWFASYRKEHHSQVGLLIGLDFTHVPSVGALRSVDASTASMKELVELGGDDPLYSALAWQPPPMSNRILVQHSHFVFGRVNYTNTGTLSPPPFNNIVKYIAIRPELKLKLATMWSPLFNLTPAELFPDIEGFSSFNRADASIPNQPWY